MEKNVRKYATSVRNKSNMMVQGSWNVTLCRLVNIAERFEGITLLRTAGTIYATTESNIPEDLSFSNTAEGTLNLLK
jgi:hypothetical protein